MPPLPSPGKVAKLVLNWSLEDVIAENIFYFSYTNGPPLTGDFVNLAGHIEADLLAPWVGACLPLVTLNYAEYTDLDTAMGVVYSHVPAFTGTNTGNRLSANNAVVVQKMITRRYRGGHPRTYMMCGADGNLNAGSAKDWQPAFLANIQAGWAAFLALFPYNAPMGTWNPVNVSYYETLYPGGVPTKTVRTTPLVDSIISYDTKSRVCSQRRRLGKVGG